MLLISYFSTANHTRQEPFSVHHILICCFVTGIKPPPAISCFFHPEVKLKICLLSILARLSVRGPAHPLIVWQHVSLGGAIIDKPLGYHHFRGGWNHSNSFPEPRCWNRNSPEI